MSLVETIVKAIFPNDPATQGDLLAYWQTAARFAWWVVGAVFTAILVISRKLRSWLTWLFELQPYRVVVVNVRARRTPLVFQPDRLQSFWGLGWRGSDRMTQIVYRGRVVNNAPHDYVLLDASIVRPHTHGTVDVQDADTGYYGPNYAVKASSLTPMSASFYPEGIIFDAPTDQKLDLVFRDNHGIEHKIKNVHFRCVTTAAEFAARAPAVPAPRPAAAPVTAAPP